MTRIFSKLFFWRNLEYIKKEIEAVLSKAQKHGLVDSSSREIIENILEFTHILVREIMIPRTEIVAVSTEATTEEIIKEAIESRHTRIPVYRGTIDNIIGILNVKDLLKFWSKANYERRYINSADQTILYSGNKKHPSVVL